ncbi:MAG: hypothetical protein HY268_27820 [Deltaproteobacteria bacterium]|nr:hypothetical protein [Deltaproteobacteria bacterium]
MKISTVRQVRQTPPRQKPSEEGPRADVIGGYLVCMAALFAVCVALVDLKVALWGFGLLHLGCALIVCVWWWQDSQRGDKAKPRPFPALEQEHKAAGAFLTEHAISVRR